MIRTKEILGQLIGNMFEEPKTLIAEKGPRGGIRKYLAGDLPISKRRVQRLQRQGWLSDDGPTQKAILWYQDSLRDGNQDH